MDFLNKCRYVYYLHIFFQNGGVSFPYIRGIHVNHEDIVQDTFYIASFGKYYLEKDYFRLKLILPYVLNASEKSYYQHTLACFDGFAQTAFNYENLKQTRIDFLSNKYVNTHYGIRRDVFNEELYYSNILCKLSNIDEN